MRRTVGIFMVLALVAGIATTVTAKRERKEQPKARDVEETLEALGAEHAEHFPEKIKIKRISSVQIGDTYYHVFEGKLDTVGYHIIVFDNYNNYLGYYKCSFAPCNYQMDNMIVIDSGDVDADGEPLYYPIPIDPEKGLPGKVEIGGIPTKFVKNPTLEEAEKKEAGATGGGEAAGDAEDGKVVPEFREWTIKFKGQELEVRAIYIKQTFAEVTLKGEASGKEKGFPINSLSKEDREYIKQFK